MCQQAISQAITMPAATNGDRLSRAWPAVEVCVLAATLVLFNAYPEKIGYVVTATAPSSFVPLLAAGFEAHLPWLNVWWGAGLVLAAARLAYGRWTPALRWAGLGLHLLGLYLLLRLILGGPLVRPDAPWPPGLRASLPPFLKTPALGLNAALKAGLGLWLIVASMGFVQKLMGLLRAEPDGSWAGGRAGRCAAGLACGLGLTVPLALLLGNTAFLGIGLPLGLALGVLFDCRRQDGSRPS